MNACQLVRVPYSLRFIFRQVPGGRSVRAVPAGCFVSFPHGMQVAVTGYRKFGGRCGLLGIGGPGIYDSSSGSGGCGGGGGWGEEKGVCMK
jgi:hypothetical protein